MHTYIYIDRYIYIYTWFRVKDLRVRCWDLGFGLCRRIIEVLKRHVLYVYGIF